MPFACIHIPDFPVAALLRQEPALASQPVAVMIGQPPLEKVFAVNEAARQDGIEAGMTRLSAEAWCDLTLRKRSLLAEESAQAALLDCTQRFSPQVEAGDPGTLLLDLAGMEPLLGSPAKIAQALFDAAAKQNLTAQVAVAANPDAATLAARGFCGVTVIPEGQEATKLGGLPLEVLLANGPGAYAGSAQRSLFDDLRSASGTAASSAKDALFRADELLDLFDRWGLRNLRALAALPEVSVRERLGEQGLHLQRLARGSVQRTLVPVEAPLCFEEALDLEDVVALLEPLSFLLNRMLEALCQRLTHRALATNEVRLRMQLERVIGEYDDGSSSGQVIAVGGTGKASTGKASPGKASAGKTAARKPSTTELDALDASGFAGKNIFERKLRLPLPTQDARLLWKLLQLDLQANPPGASVVKLWLRAEPVKPRPAQRGLFLPSSPEPEQLELTLARLHKITGNSSSRIGVAEPLDTHRPGAFAMQRFVSTTAANPPEAADDASKEAPLTALRLFRPPLTATVTLCGRIPVRVICQPAIGKSGKRSAPMAGDVIWCAGPWQGSGEWWNEQEWQREEWDVALHSLTSAPALGAVSFYRLTRDSKQGNWLVEGTYD